VIQKEINELKAQRKATPKHVTLDDLPKEQQFKKLSIHSKQFIDTIKMIAYRSETSMSQILREKLGRTADSRSVLRAMYRNSADLIVSEENKTLTVRLHYLAHHAHTEAIRHLCDELDATETIFPGTELRLRYELGTS
jgi:hypothetical protein